MLIYQGQEFDNLYKEVSRLKLVTSDLQQENAQLSIQLHQPHLTTVQNIDVECTVPTGDHSLSLACSRYVKEQMSFLIGRDVSILINHPDIPSRILDGQICTVDKHKLRLHVQLLVLGTSVYIKIKATSAN